MAIESVGFVGWRGMVGSVLLERMQAEGDFSGIEPLFYSTSQTGQPAPDVGVSAPPLADAYDLNALAAHDAIVSCQGGDYTKQVLPELRNKGWQGYWIDAASAKRLDDDTVLVLDPVNRPVIDAGIEAGCKSFVGANCTVSLMIMALHGLFERGWVEWVSAMTYQAASGAGARHMRELVAQMQHIGDGCREMVADPNVSIIEIDRQLRATSATPDFPMEHFGVPLATSLIPWIDSPMPDGQTREEWKAMPEGNKVLGSETPIPMDGVCVRVGSMRSHCQAFTVKLVSDIPLDEIESALDGAHPWVHLVPNEREASIEQLSPAAVTDTLDVPVGRVHKLKLGAEYLGAFSVGDQLLWGAAEPLRRVLDILRKSV